MGNFFHSPRKVTGQNLDKFKVPCKCDRSDYKYQPVTAEGELTLEGVYEQFLLDMQNDRHWAKSTCIAYDREFWRSVAPVFRGIPYADLNEELAEKLWMERGQFGLGDRIIEQNAKKIFSCIVEQAYQLTCPRCASGEMLTWNFAKMVLRVPLKGRSICSILHTSC